MACGDIRQVRVKIVVIRWIWFIPYPWIEERIRNRFGYDFAWVKSTRYLFFEHLEGCCNGRLHVWYASGFGFGSSTYVGVTYTFTDRLSDHGPCDADTGGIGSFASGLRARRTAPFTRARRSKSS